MRDAGCGGSLPSFDLFRCLHFVGTFGEYFFIYYLFTCTFVSFICDGYFHRWISCGIRWHGTLVSRTAGHRKKKKNISDDAKDATSDARRMSSTASNFFDKPSPFLKRCKAFVVMAHGVALYTPE